MRGEKDGKKQINYQKDAINSAYGNSIGFRKVLGRKKQYVRTF